MRKAILAVLTTAMLAACSSGERSLHDLRKSTGGPDEFSVSPVNQLELPDSFTLPQPTPNGTNLADKNPKAAAIAALGGRASAQVAGGIPRADAALVAHTARNGVDANIRANLAAEDARFRQNRKRFTLLGGIFAKDRYFRAYARQALDAYSELARFRNLGVATPSAPPAQ